MSKNNLIFISMLILFILSIGMVSAAEIGLDGEISDSAELDEIGLDQSFDLEATEDSLEIPSESQLEDIGDDDEDTNEETNEENDENDQEMIVSGNTFEDIQNAILSCEANGTIKINGTYYGSGNYIYVNKNLTLEGENAVLDANNLSGILVSEKAIILKNIIFKNSDKNEAVHIEGNATFVNCTFENNKHMAIKCMSNQKSDSTIIKECTFKNNYMVLETIGTNLNIENSTFKSNKAEGWSDAVFKISDTKSYASELSIKNSSFISNSGEAEVFHFDLINPNSSNMIYGCYFNKNKADDYAVIYLENGKLSIKNSIFGNNTRVISTDVPNVHSNNNTLSIQNSTFENNRKFVLDNNANCSIVSCSFKNNSALISNYDLLSIKNSKFINNKATIDHWSYRTLSITNSTFTNSSDDVTSIYSPNGILKVKDCTFRCTSEAAIISCNKITITKGNQTTTYKEILSFNNYLKPFSFVKFTFKNLTTTYRSGKTFNIKAVFGNSKKICSNVTFILEVYSGNEYIGQFRATTNSKGIANFKVSGLKVGSYKALLSCYRYKSYINAEDFITTKASVRIKKANTTVQAPEVKFKYKKTRYFKATIKDKATKKIIKGLKVKIKVYTGKKYKTYTVKTNKYGVAKLNTKNLKRGKHKVVISSGNSNYIVSRKSMITIK